jgi:hypothetical protein
MIGLSRYFLPPGGVVIADLSSDRLLNLMPDPAKDRLDGGREFKVGGWMKV